MPGRPWMADEIAFLREHYAARSSVWIGRRLQRSPACVGQKAMALGITKTRPRCWWRGAFADYVAAAAAAGSLDGQIATDWSREHPDEPIDRRTAHYIRTKCLRIPASAAQRKTLRMVKQDGLRKQMATLGLRSPGQLWARKNRRLAIAAGWPTSCTPAECRILTFLASDGQPHTRREIAVAVGCNPQMRTRKLLQTTRGHGSMLANLTRDGWLVASSGRPVAGEGKGRSYKTWTLSLKAWQYHRRATRRKIA